MFTLEVDFSELKSVQDSLAYIETHRTANLSTSGSYAIVVVRDRIEKGKTADGIVMETKSTKKTGKYSRQWGNKRKKKGLRTDLVNLKFSLNTFNNFKKVNSSENFRNDAIEIGFDDADSLQIAQWNNEMFGNAYDISMKEIDDTFNEYIDEFNTILMK